MPWYGYLIQWIVTLIVIPWGAWVTKSIWTLRGRILSLEVWRTGFENQCKDRHVWLQEMSDDIKEVLKGQARLEGKIEGSSDNDRRVRT